MFIRCQRSPVAATLLLLAAMLALGGCGDSAKSKAEAGQNMKILGEAVVTYHDNHDNKWPEQLADVKDEAVKIIAERGVATDWAKIMVNPVTGDNPGYEYVKPKEDDAMDSTVLLYQLRGGKRDTSLPVCYQSCSVRPKDP